VVNAIFKAYVPPDGSHVEINDRGKLVSMETGPCSG